MDLRAGPLVSGAIGSGLALRGFGLPATGLLVLATEVTYAAMAHAKPEWVGSPRYRASDFALDIGAALLGWGVVAAATHLTRSTPQK